MIKTGRFQSLYARWYSSDAYKTEGPSGASPKAVPLCTSTQDFPVFFPSIFGNNKHKRAPICSLTLNGAPIYRGPGLLSYSVWSYCTKCIQHRSPFRSRYRPLSAHSAYALTISGHHRPLHALIASLRCGVFRQSIAWISASPLSNGP